MRHAIYFVVAVFVSASIVESQEAKFTMSQQEKALLDLTNAERKQAELPPLKFNPVLGKVARAHSANMARQGKMEHDLDGKTPFRRLKEAGYRYGFAGENIAYGDVNIPIKTLMKAWMDSEVHRANILGKNFTEIGVGIAADDKGQLFYTQVFGRQR